MATGVGCGPVRLNVEVAGEQRLVTVEPIGADGSRFTLSWDDVSHDVDVARLRPGALSVIVTASGHSSHEVTCHETAPGALAIGIAGRYVRARVTDGRRRRTANAARAGGDHPVAAPMPGRVVRVMVEPGDTVAAGQGLAVVEAMKMENEVVAPAAGVVGAVLVVAGDTVEAGGVLLVVSGDTQGHD